MLKRIITVLTAILTVLSTLSLCTSCSSKTGDQKIRIVCSIFPQYDWVLQILGDMESNVELTLLIDSGADLHNYQPTAKDIITISGCDLFVYVGGESDTWTADALTQAHNKNRIAVSMLDSIGSAAQEEELIEGMEDVNEEEEKSESTETEYDEHVWLSLKNAETLTLVLAQALGTIDPTNAPSYRTNADGYIKKLRVLDDEYQQAVDGATQKTVLFGDRFPFRYLTEDYGLTYYAAFQGCSAETEASFATIAFLAGKIDSLSLPVILTLEGSDQKIAKTIIQNTKTKDQNILTMNSLQNITAEDVSNGATYLQVMQENLDTLRVALE